MGEIGLADRADHRHIEAILPPLAVHFAGVTAPALAGRVIREDVAVDFSEVFHVQPRDRHGVDGVAIVEKKAGLVGMAEIIEVGDLDLVAVEPRLR